MNITRRAVIVGALSAPVAALAVRDGTLLASRREPSEVKITTTERKRLVSANGQPFHAVGDFPNAHDPFALRSQKHRFEMPLLPKSVGKPVPLNMWLFGVGVNGVPFDPSGPFWNGDGNSGWEFEVLHPASAVALGIDVNHAHTQERGMYHYHGLPNGLLWDLTTADPNRPMYLLGYAADGFPIYGPDCPENPAHLKSKTRRLRSSYRLRAGRRQDGPKGRFDGRFVEDFEYDAGRGDLDECNGRTGPTPEYPDGTYYYVLTDNFPFIPRLLRGQPDPSFRHGPPPGVSPPLPTELKAYTGVV